MVALEEAGLLHTDWQEPGSSNPRDRGHLRSMTHVIVSNEETDGSEAYIHLTAINISGSAGTVLLM